MDGTIIPRLEAEGTYLFYPWRIRAQITSTGARGIRQTETVTLTRVEGGGERWEKAMDLVRFNGRCGMKELSVTIESIWTIDGREPAPEEPPSYEASAPPTSTPSSKRARRSERSEQQTDNYMNERALFWDSITQYWKCSDPLRCHISARYGLACFVHHGRHYEVIYEVAYQWRLSVRSGESTLERPSRAIRDLIIRRAEQHEQDLLKRAAKAPRPSNTSPSNPATVNNIYVGQSQPQEASVAAPVSTAERQVSPVPPELNTAANWESFWDHVKSAYSEWSVQLDRARVALESDCWNLRMLFNSSDERLARVVEQGGLRIVILEELTKFVDSYKQQQRRRQQPRVASPRGGPQSAINIPSDPSSSPYQSSASNAER